MSTEQKAEAMALPLGERVSLAQTLWESIGSEMIDTTEADTLRDSLRRDEELSSGSLTAREHADVMKSARRSIGCD